MLLAQLPVTFVLAIYPSHVHAAIAKLALISSAFCFICFWCGVLVCFCGRVMKASYACTLVLPLASAMRRLPAPCCGLDWDCLWITAQGDVSGAHCSLFANVLLFVFYVQLLRAAPPGPGVFSAQSAMLEKNPPGLIRPPSN